jgi:hypothetical protein
MKNPNGTFELVELLSALLLTCSNNCYKNPKDPASVGDVSIAVNSAATQSVLAFKPPESDLVPYECCRSSGVLSFWDNPTEDIYSFQDGQPT